MIFCCFYCLFIFILKFSYPKVLLLFGWFEVSPSHLGISPHYNINCKKKKKNVLKRI